MRSDSVDLVVARKALQGIKTATVGASSVAGSVNTPRQF